MTDCKTRKIVATKTIVSHIIWENLVYVPWNRTAREPKIPDQGSTVQ